MKSKVRRGIGLVAHDAMKKDLIEWVLWNSELLMGNKFYCTGATGTLILEALKEHILFFEESVAKYHIADRTVLFALVGGQLDTGPDHEIELAVDTQVGGNGGDVTMFL